MVAALLLHPPVPAIRGTQGGGEDPQGRLLPEEVPEGQAPLLQGFLHGGEAVPRVPGGGGGLVRVLDWFEVLQG